MLTKIAFAAALVLGAAAAAQANDDPGGAQGGFQIGPMGQRLGGPVYGSRYRGFGPFAYERGYARDYAYVPRYHREWRYER
jgi:hypothetical protein